jgi:uncharacterized protein
MVSLPIFTAFAAAVLSTSFISGIFGMAGGMILMGILLAIMPLPAAMVLHGVTQMASNGWRAWLWRAHIRWEVMARYAAGAVVVALALAALRLTPSTSAALIVLGLMPLIGLCLPGRLAPDIGRGGHAFACGAVCTVLQLLAGVSGPVFDVFFVRSAFDRKEVVATKAAIQVFGHFLKVAYFGPLLVASGETVAPVAIILAVALALVGTQLSRRVLDAISDAQFRNWSRRLVAVIAAVYLMQGLFLVVAERPGMAEVIAATVALLSGNNAPADIQE